MDFLLMRKERQVFFGEIWGECVGFSGGGDYCAGAILTDYLVDF